MTTIAALSLTVADGWSISIGGGWIAAMMIAMAVFCAAGMLFMWLMPGGRHGFMCGMWGRGGWNLPPTDLADSDPGRAASEGGRQ